MDQGIQILCRVCGLKTSNLRRLTPITKRLIFNLYHVNVDKDDRPGVHPEKCCLKCASALKRHHDIKYKRGGPKPAATFPELATFPNQPQDCLEDVNPRSTMFASNEDPCDSDEYANEGLSKRMRITILTDSSTQTTVEMNCSTTQALPQFMQADAATATCLDQAECATQTENSIAELICHEGSRIFGNMTSKQLLMVAHTLGKSQHRQIKRDCYDMSHSIKSLLDINMTSYMNQRNPAVLGFLLGVADKDLKYGDTEAAKESQKQTVYKISKTVESIMNLSAHRLIMPLHFRDSLILYSVTGSRLALTVLCASAAHASYPSTKRFLHNLGTKSNDSSIPGDVVFAFDNNQILHRAWNVNIESKFRCHIVTMVVQFEADKAGTLQWREDLKPGIWMLNPGSVACVRTIDQDRNVKKIHYDAHLYPHLMKIIAEVAAEQTNQTVHGSPFRDPIDALVEQQKHAENFRTCQACGDANVPNSKIKCPSCKVNLKQAELQALGINECGTWEERPAKTTAHTAKTFRVSFPENNDDNMEMMCTDKTPHPVHEEAKEYCVNDPVFVNPCSYEACAVVLRNIGRKAGVRRYGGDRELVFLCCDGSPYILCARLILSTYMCELCKESFSGIEASSKHTERHKDNGKDAAMVLEFDWALLIPGPGHLEMNMVRSFVELTWPIFYKALAQLMNFRSDNALNAAKRVSDHHKGWQLCTIAREALTRELILPWVRIQLTSDQPDLSPDTFFKFLMADVHDKTYAMIGDLVLELLDSIFLYRKGIREGSHDLAYAARAKIAKIWTGRPHSSYREIEMTDSIMLERMPEELKESVMKCWSINISGRAGTGQGPDFRLEEINKQTQSWLPKVPTGEDWRTVCNNFTVLSDLRSETLKQLGINDPKSANIKQQDKLKEIEAFRVLLRQKQYLLHPEKENEVISLEGQRLSQAVGKFCQLARDKRARYFDAYLEFEPMRSVSRRAVPFKEPPVFVTMEEESAFNSLSSKTIKELQELTESRLQCVVDAEIKAVFKSALDGTLSVGVESASSSRNRLLKSEYMQILDEIQEYLKYQSTLPRATDMPENSGSDFVI